MAFWINKNCTKCAACLAECPTGSIVEGKDQYFIDVDTCADHAACVKVCPVDAIHPFKPAPLTQAPPAAATGAKGQKK